MSESNKITRFPKLLKLNVGTLIFIIIAAYFAFSAYNYSKKTTVNFYEVTEGSIVKEHVFTGLIVREEEVVRSSDTGYVNYYISDGHKIPKNSAVYSIDSSGSLREYLKQHSDQYYTPGRNEINEVRTLLSSANRTYSDSKFAMTYSVMPQLQGIVSEYADMSILAQMEAELKSQGINYNSYSSDRSGTVAYYTDGYEDFDPADISAESFDTSKYTKNHYKSGDTVLEGDPVYKLITSEKWKLLFPLSDEDLADFSEKSSLKVSFGSNGIETTAPFGIIKGGDGQNYGELSFSRYMVQFFQQRLIEFQIVRNEASGLKIPEKSVTTKDFCIIPSEYLVSDSNGEKGFYKAVIGDSGTSFRFVRCDITENNGEYCYIECTDSSELKIGDRLSKDGITESNLYEIGPMKSLEGVYNINKGYTVFKHIEPLETSNGYTIINSGTMNGLSVYDHIVLDATTVEDGELLFW